MFRAGILTVSTSGHEGRRQDASGMVIRELLNSPHYDIEQYEIISDDQEVIEDRLKRWSFLGLNLIVSTGGTGLSPRDVTPEACLAVIDREVPGLAEMMRMKTFEKTPMAMLSRSVAGTLGSTLIITLPGSPTAVRECLEVIIPVLPHALEILTDSSNGHPRTS